MISHLGRIWVYVQFYWVFWRSWLIISRHLLLTLILLNFFNFIVCSLINFIFRLRSFMNLVRENYMWMLIRRLVIFQIFHLSLILSALIIVLGYHLWLGILISLKTNWINVWIPRSIYWLTSLSRFLFRWNFLLT